MPTTPNEALKEARDQLTLVLSFFSRVDAKASVVLAIDTGMLAVLASNASPVHLMTPTSIIASVATILTIAGSFWFLYKVSFPVLHGGHESLVYFREIANKREARFIDDFIAQNEDARLRDLLGQVWRNSEILKLKFHSLRWAYVLMALGVIPWVISVALFSSQNPGAHSLLAR